MDCPTASVDPKEILGLCPQLGKRISIPFVVANSKVNGQNAVGLAFVTPQVYYPIAMYV